MNSSPAENPVVVLVGPTAIGKTAISLAVARRWPCEVVSVDSMQIYRFMDIGTAKASNAEQREVAHHFIDIVNPDEEYDAARFALEARRVIGEIAARGKVALLVGGSGLYLQTLLHGVFPGPETDPTSRAELRARLAREGSEKLHQELIAVDRISAERIHHNDTQRLLRALEVYVATGVPWSEHLHHHRQQAANMPPLGRLLQIGLTSNRDTLYQRINQRCREMLSGGLEEEVSSLLERGYSAELKPMKAIGYRHMIQYINGIWTREKTAELLARDTRRYAKRQFTWFARMAELRWFQRDQEERLVKEVDNWLGQGRKL